VSDVTGQGPRWNEADVPDCRGRTALITGASSGLGLSVCTVLAARGARVVLACRDTGKGQDAAGRIGAAVPGAAAEVVRLDLASLSSVREAAAQVRERHDRLDLLVNNAGLMMAPRAATADGFELHLGTNHLGHFALTGPLLDRLLAAAGAQAASLAAHPGFARTALLRHLPAGIQAGARLVGPLIAQDAQMGALPVLRAATDPAARGGQYYGPGGLGHLTGYPEPVTAARRARDGGVQARLWEESERLTGVSYAL
jgi:hypothetical protein